MFCTATALLALAAPAHAVVPRLIETNDVKRYWTGSLQATRTLHATGPDGFVKDVTESMSGHVRTFEGSESGAAALEVADARTSFTQTSLDTSGGPCTGEHTTERRATVAGSVQPNQQVGVWIGRPRHPLTSVPTGPTILSVPNISNQNVRFRTAVQPPCDTAPFSFDDGLSPPWAAMCSGTDPWHWMPLPAPTVLPDGKTLRIQGTKTVTCAYPSVPETDTMTVTIDVLGTLEPPVEYRLTAAAAAFGGGRGSITGGLINCGAGKAVCSQVFVKGATAVVAAIPSATSKFMRWEGCDVVVGQQCRVAMTRARSVRAWFGYDFVGQAPEPSFDLFDPNRKAEIAQNGADDALDGAVGCGLTALSLTGIGLGAPVIATGSAGTGGATTQVGSKLLEETLGNCITGTLGTMANGLLLEIDPPDPNWQKAAYAERMARAKVRGCKLRKGCTKILTARRRLVDASTRVTELQEALAVAANRFGNASGKADKRGRLLHRASMRATSGMLADALALRDRRGRELAKQLRAAGIKSMAIPKKVAAAALAKRAAKTPKSVISRLLRKRLVTSAAAVHTAIKAQAALIKPARIDVLAQLRQPSKTAAMRRTAGALTIADLAILLDAFHADLRPKSAIRTRHEKLMDAVLACNSSSPAQLRALAKDVQSKTGLGGEPGRQVAYVARKLAAKGRPSGPACG